MNASSGGICIAGRKQRHTLEEREHAERQDRASTSSHTPARHCALLNGGSRRAVFLFSWQRRHAKGKPKYEKKTLQHAAPTQREQRKMPIRVISFGYRSVLIRKYSRRKAVPEFTREFHVNCKCLPTLNCFPPKIMQSVYVSTSNCVTQTYMFSVEKKRETCQPWEGSRKKTFPRG